MEYQPLERLILMIDEPNRSACLRIISDHLPLFERVQGSTHNHQAWPGGYRDHVTEVMNIAYLLYSTMGELRALPFSRSDALLVLFLHDLEKPWKYQLNTKGQLEEKPEFKGNKRAQHEFRMRQLAHYGITLTSAQLNGLKYVEGELDDYKSTERVMNELAGFCHMCDVASARLWPTHPYEEFDSWPFARRHRTTTP